MPRFTAPLPQETIPADLDMETAPQTNILAGGAISAFNQFFGPGAAILNFAQEGLTKEMDPGKQLSAEEYEKSPLKVPGLSFPNGVSENVARIRHTRAQNKERTEGLINAMPPGFLSWTSRNVGSLIGMAGTFAVDPLAAGAAEATTSLTTRMAPWVLSKMEGTAATLTARAGIGFGEAAVAGAPIVAAQYENDRELGQDHGVLSILTNAATFGLFGAGLRLGFGFDRGVVKPEEHRRAQQVSIDHLMNGKPAYVEPIVKNGAYQMAEESQAFLARSEDMIEELPTRIEEVGKQIDAKVEELNKELKNKKDLRDITDIERGNEFVQRLERLHEKPSDLRTEEETEFAKRYTSPTLSEREPTILKKVFDITEKSPVRRTEEEQELLDSFVSTEEPEVISKEIRELSTKRDKILDELKETKGKALKTKLRFKAADLDDRIAKNIDHLGKINKIDKIEEGEPQSFKLRTELKELQARKEILESTLDANKVYSTNINENQSPVSENEIRGWSDKVADWRSDFAYSEIDHKRFENDIKSIPDDVQFDSQNAFDILKDLRDSGELTGEVEEFLDAVEKDDKDFESISGSIRKWFDCVIKRGE